jgi:hypothetical protein
VTELLDERTAAVRALDLECPHCGAERAPDQAFCVECGYALPRVRGRLPVWRRRWIARLGWYPGDWVWTALLALVVAVAGAAAAIAVSRDRDASSSRVFTALANIRVQQPLVATPATTAAGTLPVTPPKSAAGKQAWPPGETGWTIVLVSYPKTAGRPAAQATAAKAAQRLPEVGVLDSSLYASLQPGYFVIFSGIYSSQAEANGAVAAAHSAGFGAAYSRQIAG